MRDLIANAIALDIETAPKSGAPQEYALQPWRTMEGTAHITCISIARHDGQALLYVDDWKQLLDSLAGQYVTTWNGIFDVSWLIAAGLWKEVKAIKWVDVMLLWKWLSNSQRAERMPKWSLADGAKRFCKDEPWLDAFISMKKAEQHAGENDAYWEQRAKLDAIVTAKICKEIMAGLTDQQIKSAMVEAATIPEFARSWLIGVQIDYGLLESIRPVITEEMRDLEFELGVSNFKGSSAERVKRDATFWTPSKILRSPQQLGDLIYGSWGLVAKNFSEKTGKPSTDKSALTYLADDDDRAIEILRWRELNTQLSKYIEAPLKARKYLGSETTHASPRLFSSYTGRLTYASKTSKKFQTGIALHQWPRKKELRALVRPPKGYKHVEFDAAGQESRIMAEQSGDVAMRNVFVQDMDFHSFTGAAISGMTYDDFMVGKAAGNSAIVGAGGLRYAGKFCNLSQNFRVGAKKMRIQARVQYNLNVDFMTVVQWQTTFKRLFPNIKAYWGLSIQKAKELGYAETLGGRRFKIDMWDKDSRWGSESSALMFPIQGTGADMKELAVRDLSIHYPELLLWFDLHDGIHMLAKEDYPDSKLIEAREMLDNIDYQKAWGYTPSVPLLWDVQVGARWSELVELKRL